MDLHDFCCSVTTLIIFIEFEDISMKIKIKFTLSL